MRYNSGMDTQPKIATSYRLTPEARDLIARLAEHMGLSQTAVIETAIRQLARREKAGL